MKGYVMKKIFMMLLLCFIFVKAADENAHYGVYRDAKLRMEIEKEFITNLKPQNPDDVRTGGYAKFRATLLSNDKAVLKELETKMDIVRSIILDVISGFMAVELQSPQGRAKFANVATTSINAILTDGNVLGMVFGDFVIQP